MTESSPPSEAQTPCKVTAGIWVVTHSSAEERLGYMLLWGCTSRMIVLHSRLKPCASSAVFAQHVISHLCKSPSQLRLKPREFGMRIAVLPGECWWRVRIGNLTAEKKKKKEDFFRKTWKHLQHTPHPNRPLYIGFLSDGPWSYGALHGSVRQQQISDDREEQRK